MDIDQANDKTQVPVSIVYPFYHLRHCGNRLFFCRTPSLPAYQCCLDWSREMPFTTGHYWLQLRNICSEHRHRLFDGRHSDIPDPDHADEAKAQSADMPHFGAWYSVSWVDIFRQDIMRNSSDYFDWTTDFGEISASIATIIRLPFCNAYSLTKDQMCKQCRPFDAQHPCPTWLIFKKRAHGRPPTLDEFRVRLRYHSRLAAHAAQVNQKPVQFQNGK